MNTVAVITNANDKDTMATLPGNERSKKNPAVMHNANSIANI
jgi:hypothetical protein